MQEDNTLNKKSELRAQVKNIVIKEHIYDYKCHLHHSYFSLIWIGVFSNTPHTDVHVHTYRLEQV